MKPKHASWYSGDHASICEQTLVTLLHRLGPWRDSLYLVGGLAPRYLFPGTPHVGTTDVDLVVSLELLSSVAAYRSLESNLKSIGFSRSIEDGQPVHLRWRRPVSNTVSVVVELLCETAQTTTPMLVRLSDREQVAALGIAGANLAVEDHFDVPLTADLLDGGGVATETVKVVGLAAFLVLKARAYGDRGEQKDAYDLVHCLMHAEPSVAAAQFSALWKRTQRPELVDAALRILRLDFVSDPTTSGHRKNGPIAYATFLTNPAGSDPDTDMRHRRSASAIVEEFVRAVDAISRSPDS